MMTPRFLLLAVLTILTACATSPDAGDGPTASAGDLARLSETSWSGTLGYLDYSTRQWATIPVAIRFDASKDRGIRFHIKYPGETQYNKSDTLTVSRDGRSFKGAALIERRQEGDATVLVTQSRGKDDGRDGDIRTTYFMSDSTLTITKHVRFDGEQDFFRRNAYELAR